MGLFRDNMYDPNGTQTMFEFFKISLLKQMRIRSLIAGVIKETSLLMKQKPNDPDSYLKFVRPWDKRFMFNPNDCGIKEDISFEVYCLFRSFHNPDLEGFSALNLHQYHILFQLLEHELSYTETEVQGINLKFVMFSEISCSNMSKFLKQMHGLDMIPLTHPNGYRQVMFQDYKNEFGKGYNALFLHTSPHKQYYVYINNSLEEWLQNHLNKLKNRYFLMQSGKISYFYEMRNQHLDEDFKNGSFMVKNDVEISSQGKFEMLQSSIYPETYGVPCEFFFVIKFQFRATSELKHNIVMKKIILKIHDNSRDKNTGELKRVVVPIERVLKEESKEKE